MAKLIAAVPANAAAVRAADTNLSDMTITSVSNGYSLDDQNGTAGAGSIIVTDTAPGYDEGRHLGEVAADDSFTIVNTSGWSDAILSSIAVAPTTGATVGASPLQGEVGLTITSTLSNTFTSTSRRRWGTR